MNLDECRQELDRIDEQIVDLFEQRMKVSADVAEVKIAEGRPVYDPEREQAKLDSVMAMTHDEYNREAIREVYAQLMTISRRFQCGILAQQGQAEEFSFECVDALKKEGVRVVFQGVEGAFAHQAVLSFFGDDQDIFHVRTFEEAVKTLLDGGADYAVLPIENSTAGAVTDNYDLLVTYPVYVVGEVVLPVSHALLGTADADITDIRTVYSHPQALAQSSVYLNAHGWHQISYENTAVAAKKVMEENDKTQAAVASNTAAKLYGLKVLQSDIQNVKNNATRFFVLSPEPVFVRNADKISVCFESPHTYGALYNLLGNFVFNHLNMVKIESRPIPERTWDYRFFVDFEGNLNDDEVRNALRAMEEEAVNIRVLGNYPEC